MNDGWIKLHRRLNDSSIKRDPNTLVLWIHLLLNANSKPYKFLNAGEEIELQPGQLKTGRKKLAEETGLTEQNIRTSLNSLKSTSKVTIKAYSKFSIITINNWSRYQEGNQVTNQQLTSNQPATNHNTRKRERENNKEHEHFESLWNRYPNRKGKKEAQRHFNASVKNEQDLQDINMALDNYISEIQKNGTAKQFIKHGSTWFNNWRDYAEVVDYCMVCGVNLENGPVDLKCAMFDGSSGNVGCLHHTDLEKAKAFCIQEDGVVKLESLTDKKNAASLQLRAAVEKIHLERLIKK